MNRLRVLLSLVLIWCLPLGVAADQTTFAIATAPYTYHFPRDHAAHTDYQTEWWYYTGHLVAHDGRPFGFELTFFRVGLAPGDPPLKPGMSRWHGNELYPAHFAVSDEQGKQFFSDERFSREALDIGGASAARLAVHVGDWTLRQDTDGTMVLHARSGEHALDLKLTSEKPPAIHGSGGITKKGACRSCASHYYSLTRLSAIGTVAVSSEPIAVTGQAWMDHEYGSSQLERDQVGWDWFSFQFNDKQEVMYYQLRTNANGISKQSSGSFIKRDGNVTPLHLGDVACRVVNTWTSTSSHAVYPSTWSCRIPRAGREFLVVPRLLDQELLGTSPLSLAYWEGDVALLDMRHHEIGSGYVELTGYSGAVRL